MAVGAMCLVRAQSADLNARTPELQVLKGKSAVVLGLGCLGAPSAIELAKAGVGSLRLVDHDFVDASTVRRWPLGVCASGIPKALMLQGFIVSQYPWTDVRAHVHRIGAVRSNPEHLRDSEVIGELLTGTSLIYDATAEFGVQHLFSEYALANRLPYIAVTGSPGGWGGKVFRMVPGRSACWNCYREACMRGLVPDPPYRPGDGVQTPGCADPTFTGAGFDMLQIALAGVRLAVSTMCVGSANAYPDIDHDVIVISLRGTHGEQILPEFRGYTVPRQPGCRCAQY